MTLPEKIGQMVQIEATQVTDKTTACTSTGGFNMPNPVCEQKIFVHQQRRLDPGWSVVVLFGRTGVECLRNFGILHRLTLFHPVDQVTHLRAFSGVVVAKFLIAVQNSSPKCSPGIR